MGVGQGQEGLPHRDGAYRKRERPLPSTVCHTIPGDLGQRAGPLMKKVLTPANLWEVVAVQMPYSLSVVCDLLA